MCIGISYQLKFLTSTVSFNSSPPEVSILTISYLALPVLSGAYFKKALFSIEFSEIALGSPETCFVKSSGSAFILFDLLAAFDAVHYSLFLEASPSSPGLWDTAVTFSPLISLATLTVFFASFCWFLLKMLKCSFIYNNFQGIPCALMAFNTICMPITPEISISIMDLFPPQTCPLLFFSSFWNIKLFLIKV